MVELISAGLTEVGTSDIADGAVTAPKLDSGATWKFLGETILTGAGTNLAVASLPAYKYLMGIWKIEPAAAGTHLFKFNDDSGANYDYVWTALRASRDVGSAAAATGIATIGNTEFEMSGVFYITNDPALQKQMWWNGYFNVGAESHLVGVGNWANTADSISKIDYVYSANM